MRRKLYAPLFDGITIGHSRAMRGVALTQRKGGAGKTVLSHALALGASWHNVPAYLMHTDNREPLKVNGRPYMYLRRPGTKNITNTCRCDYQR